ncbi:helicase HerA domain-containing protein [Microcoleus sp. Pol17_C1]|uniref:helicase HerA domain-containing protein n=1 Tax=unclassified Microcoleus TaxID=2642155 RepID=UPI002FD42553
MSISQQLTQTKIFKSKSNGDWDTGFFVGRPFRLSYNKAEILVADAWKQRAKGIPQGCFLLAYYDNELDDKNNAEAILLRVIQPSKLPTDQNVISSMVEYYKDDIKTGENKHSQLDTFTRYEFSFSGLECSVLGSFYVDKDRITRFGADLENFYSAHNYSVIKPSSDILKAIVNYRENGTPGGSGDIKIGKVRYSSSRRFQQTEQEVPVYVQAPDFAGKRTALFGMTRTGKSNTVKKIIQACVDMSNNAPLKLDERKETPEEVLNNLTEDNNPKYPIGQIIFDINGEYANPNLQDQGTAIFDLYQSQTVRYSTVPKPDFLEMKVNFYREIENGFGLIRSYPSVANNSSNYIRSFTSIDFTRPEDYATNRSAKARYDRRVAVYLCCLYRANFKAPSNFPLVCFTANQDVRNIVQENVDPNSGLNLEQAANWWEMFWDVYDEDPDEVFSNYRRQKGYEWADEDLKALLVMLTRKSRSGGNANVSGFRILNPIREQHTSTVQQPFDQDILSNLRQGKIVIVDLSLGNPEIQVMFSEKICLCIFADAINRFTSTHPNNFIQFYFEEAHNLFPKKDDKDLSQIYNRLAKEGAKLNLGLVYATQEVSSISSNILKATQNWFISHLNNEDEIKELRKYYDFSDFTESLIRFSQDTDKGFVRMKTYSNPFVIPVQIDRFPPEN